MVPMGNSVLDLILGNKAQEVCRSGAAWVVVTMRHGFPFFPTHNPDKEPTLVSSDACLKDSCGIQPWRKYGSKAADWFSSSTSGKLRTVHLNMQGVKERSTWMLNKEHLTNLKYEMEMHRR